MGLGALLHNGCNTAGLSCNLIHTAVLRPLCSKAQLHAKLQLNLMLVGQICAKLGSRRFALGQCAELTCVLPNAYGSTPRLQ